MGMDIRREMVQERDRRRKIKKARKRNARGRLTLKKRGMSTTDRGLAEEALHSTVLFTLRREDAVCLLFTIW